MSAHCGETVAPLAFSYAVDDVLEATTACAERVIAVDTDGRVVTTDLYALGLRAATKHNVHPVRVWTAVIDIAWGIRDYMRGPKPQVVSAPFRGSSWLPGNIGR